METNKKILVIGEMDITGELNKNLISVLGLPETTLVDYDKKPLKYFIPKNIFDYEAVLTSQNNPHILKNMKKRMKTKDKEVKLFKQYKDEKGNLIGLMEIHNVIVKYEHTLYKFENTK